MCVYGGTTDSDLSQRLTRSPPQGIINIVYIVGVNPMAQSSSSMMYNPMLMMCQNLYQTSYSQMGGVGGFPIYNQYLYHYCFVDPQEVGLFLLHTSCFMLLKNILF